MFGKKHQSSWFRQSNSVDDLRWLFCINDNENIWNITIGFFRSCRRWLNIKRSYKIWSKSRREMKTYKLQSSMSAQNFLWLWWNRKWICWHRWTIRLMKGRLQHHPLNRGYDKKNTNIINYANICQFGVVFSETYKSYRYLCHRPMFSKTQNDENTCKICNRWSECAKRGRGNMKHEETS